MDDLINRIKQELKSRREKVLNGGVNCIPSPFPSFRDSFVGTEQKRYYLISSQQKSGKTQLTSFIFIFNNLLYAYYHPGQVRLKIFYYPLEETKEDITLRFMSYLLFRFSNHSIRICPDDLRSTNEINPVPKEILDLFDTPEYKDVLDFFQKTVIFEESTNPTGVWKDLNNYAKEHGTLHYTEVIKKNSAGIDEKVKKFDYYEPNDPDEYVEIIWDHISLTTLERGMDLRNSISKLSEYFVALKNRYSYIPIIIQQQSTETQNLDAFKMNKIRPTPAGLADNKNTGRDCDSMLSIINPFAFELPTYLKYRIDKFGDNIRFLEISLNRHGRKNEVLPLYFDGAICFYHVLPSSADTKALESVYNYIDQIRKTEKRNIEKAKPNMAMFCHSFYKKIIDRITDKQK